MISVTPVTVLPLWKEVCWGLFGFLWGGSVFGVSGSLCSTNASKLGIAIISVVPMR